MVDEMIRFENVTYKYSTGGGEKELVAVSNINLSVKKGRIPCNTWS